MPQFHRLKVKRRRRWCHCRWVACMASRWRCMQHARVFGRRQRRGPPPQVAMICPDTAGRARRTGEFRKPHARPPPSVPSARVDLGVFCLFTKRTWSSVIRHFGVWCERPVGPHPCTGLILLSPSSFRPWRLPTWRRRCLPGRTAELSKLSVHTLVAFPQGWRGRPGRLRACAAHSGRC